MSRKHLINAIKREADADIRIAPELAEVLAYTSSNASPGSGMYRADIEAACPEASYDRLRRLTEEIGLLNETSEGADSYLLNQRTNRRAYGDAMEPAVNEELQRVNQHIKSDPHVRQVVAKALGVSPNQVGSVLFEGDLFQKRDRLEKIINAIKANQTVQQGDYGRLDWRSTPNVYEATERAVSLHRR